MKELALLQGPLLGRLLTGEICESQSIKRTYLRDGGDKVHWTRRFLALDLWREVIGDVCDEIDDASLAAAQAGLL